MADAHNPLEQFIIQTWIPIKIGNLDASFTNSSAFMLLGVVCASALMVLAVRPRAGVPGRWQLIAELSENLRFSYRSLLKTIFLDVQFLTELHKFKPFSARSMRFIS